MTKTKILEILLIEDEPKHLADAKAEVQKAIESGLAIQVDYASSYVEVQKARGGKKYDGIISDIFFPFDPDAPEEELSWGEKAIKGWNGSAKSKCYELLAASSQLKELEEHGILAVMEEVGYTKVDQEFRSWYEPGYLPSEINLAAFKWLGGREMHPTGVLIVEEATEQGIPVVLCTDTSHHASKAEPVRQYAASRKIRLVDTYTELSSDAPAKTKRWDEAIKTLYEKISYQRE